MAKTVWLYINCWLCGGAMKVASHRYNSHASCVACVPGGWERTDADN